MYLKPHVATSLIAAVAALLPDVESEIEQRKTSGHDEYWQGLEDRFNQVSEALTEAGQGHGALSPTQTRLLKAYDEEFEGLARADARTLADHDDGLIHFLLAEVSDSTDAPDSIAEARARLQKVADQALRCAAALEPC